MPFNHDYLPDTLLDGSNWNHASHLGFSVNEINPLFALQNAPNLVYATASSPLNYTQFDNSQTIGGPVGVSNNFGTAGIPINVTQLRNLLAGTIPQDNPTTPSGTNGDLNYVWLDGKAYHVPNGVMDNGDGIITTPTSTIVSRGGTPVPGRWGEPNGIPSVLNVQPFTRATLGSTLTRGRCRTSIRTYSRRGPLSAKEFMMWTHLNERSPDASLRMRSSATT